MCRASSLAEETSCRRASSHGRSASTMGLDSFWRTALRGGVFAPDRLLDRIELGNPCDHLVADRRRGILPELDEAASPMRPAIRSHPWPLRLLRIGENIIYRMAVYHQRTGRKPLE